MKSYIVINPEETKFLTAAEQASLANILRALEHSRRLRGDSEPEYAVTTAATPTPDAGEDGELLRDALNEIADQKRIAEMSEDERHDADFETGYDQCIRTARVVLGQPALRAAKSNSPS